MSNNIPGDLKYTKSHEWVREAPNGTYEIGITDHAQGALGDLVFVEVPDVGRALNAGEACAVVESVKAASDVYSPIAGKVIANNGALSQQARTAQRGSLRRRMAVSPRSLDAPVECRVADERRRLRDFPGRRIQVRVTHMAFIPHTPDDIARMLEVVGVRSIDDLFDEIPGELRAGALNVPAAARPRWKLRG